MGLEDTQSGPHHLSDYPRLLNEYCWCPHCCHPEFVADDEDNKPYRVQRRGSKLKRAVTLFRHFCRKTCSRAKRYTPPSPYPTQICELDGSSYYRPTGRSELPASLGDQSKMSPQGSKNYDSVGWLDGQYSPNGLGNKRGAGSSHSYEPMELSSDIANEPVSGMPLEPTSPYELSVSDLESSGYESLCTLDPNNSSLCSAHIRPRVGTNRDETRSYSSVSPLSQFGVRQDFPIAKEPLSSFSYLPNRERIPTYDRSMSRSLSPIEPSESSALCNVLPQTAEANSALSYHKCVSTKTLVENLRDCMHFLGNIWIQHLKSLSINLLNSSYTIGTLFKTGHRVLKQVYEGVLPCTFQEVFSMAHVVFASTFIFHHDDTAFRWNILAHDFIRWHQVIIDTCERELFLKVACILWSPLEIMKALNLAHTHLYDVPISPFGTGTQADSSKWCLFDMKLFKLRFERRNTRR